MPDINPSLPIIGQPDSTEEPKVVTALSQLIAAVNDVDSAQIADGTIALADLATALQEALPKAGNLRMTARAAADDGWLLCDGAAVSRATYAALFTAIGTAYGAGDGTTTFNLPDLRGRTPVGVDDAAGRLTANDALGNAGGEETHTLTRQELPAGILYQTGGAETHWAYATATPGFSETLTSGPGQAHNNMQPYQVVNFQIKT